MLDEATNPYNSPKVEIGLMTKEEFLNFRNPDEKSHPDTAYQYDLVKMNQDYSIALLFSMESRGKRVSIRGNVNGMLVYIDDKLVGVIHDDVLYRNLHLPANVFPISYRDKDNRVFDIKPNSVKNVKHISDYVHLVDRVAERNRKAFPHLMNRIKVGDEYIEIRTTIPNYSTNDGASIVGMNEQGYVVARADDEWGTTLLMVVEEYRGYGLGKILGKIWYDLNPNYGSGGFTYSGSRNALKIWQDRVMTMLQNGWYSDLIKQDKISREKVKEIIAGAKGMKFAQREPEQKHKPDPVVLVDDYFFVIYDKKFLDSQEEKYVYAHGFFRDDPKENLYLFTLDYDKPFKKLATYVAFQMAKDQGFDILVRSPPSDIVELDGFDDIEVDGDFARLIKNRLDLDLLRRYDNSVREPVDPYREIYNELLNVANSKWD